MGEFPDHGDALGRLRPGSVLGPYILSLGFFTSKMGKISPAKGCVGGMKPEQCSKAVSAIYPFIEQIRTDLILSTDWCAGACGYHGE